MSTLLRVMYVLLALVPFSQGKTDKTVESKSYGYDCVQAVNTKIKLSGIFPDDNRFLIRIAYVDTKFGTSRRTYSTPTSGGIWQVSENILNATKKRNPLIHSKIAQHFDLNWPVVALSDMQIPLYSGLAIKIYLDSLQQRYPIPDTIARQAQFWKTHINPNGDTTRFINEIKSLEKVSPCTGRMNLVLVMDGSHSIGIQNYETAKQFTADLASTFDAENVPMAFIVYSATVQTIFNLNSNFDNAARREAILHASYPDLNTMTHLAINEAVHILTAENQNSVTSNKLSAPNILVVFTDGQSNHPELTVNASLYSAANNITTFACGIGSSVSQKELLAIAHNNSNHVLTSSSFDALTEFPYRVNEETCMIPQTPPVNTSVEDSVKQNETRYFAYELPPEGMTVSIVNTIGRTEGFYSYSYRTPSAAIHDGVINEVVTFIPYPKESRRRRRDVENETVNPFQVYISLKGVADKNDFNIKAIEGSEEVATAKSNILREQISIFLVTVVIAIQL